MYLFEIIVLDQFGAYLLDISCPDQGLLRELGRVDPKRDYSEQQL